MFLNNRPKLCIQAASSDSSSSEMDYVNDNPVIEVDESGMPVCPPPVSHHQLNFESFSIRYDSQIDCLIIRRTILRAVMPRCAGPTSIAWVATRNESAAIMGKHIMAFCLSS